MTGPGTGALSIRVVVPTYQRREAVLACLAALSAQRFDGPYEVVVVVDGSTDGTARALRGLTPTFPLTVLEQPNRGAAAARNSGAAGCRADVLLFLDDDMQAAPDLLSRHAAGHRDGADAVLGHLPVHPDSPHTVLLPGLAAWAQSRCRRLSRPGAELTAADLLTGQLSVSRVVFAQLGGFDEAFTAGGTFGGEDTDLGLRLWAGDHRVVFDPGAVSRQLYTVGPQQYLRQWFDAGLADVRLARKLPDRAGEALARRGALRRNRLVWRPLAAAPVVARPLAGVLCRVAVHLADRRPDDPRVRALYFRVRDLEYWRGVQRAGGVPRARSLRVLCFHAVQDLAGDPVLAPYGIPPAQLARQLDALGRWGFHVISPDELLRFVAGTAGLPRRPVLLTFDDCYADLAEVALPLLRQRGLPAWAFAVTGLPGRTNTWDQPLGARPLRLADGEQLRRLSAGGVEIGSHSRTHRALDRLPAGELAGEVAGSAAQLEAHGLPRPRALAYPYGAYDERVVAATADAGFPVAFTVRRGLVRAGADPRDLPRIEVLRRDGAGLRLLLKVGLAGRGAPLLRAARRLRAVRAAVPS